MLLPRNIKGVRVMKGLLVLVFLLSLVVSPLAMAGELGSTDSSFLFGKDQATATTISDQEMQETNGELLTVIVAGNEIIKNVNVDVKDINVCVGAIVGRFACPQ
jgi:hypothetical protein